MPKHRVPAVHVEEMSLGPPPIEAIRTDTAGFAGMTRYGPVHITGGKANTSPPLLTSFAEFESVYGGVEPLQLEGGIERPAYLALAAIAFFLNGGRRLYVSRVFKAGTGGDGVARLALPVGGGVATATWHALWPGRFGNLLVKVGVRRSRNVAIEHDRYGTARVQAERAGPGAVVEIVAGGVRVRRRKRALDEALLYGVAVDAEGRQTFHDLAGAPFEPPPGSEIRLIELIVTVVAAGERSESHTRLGLHPDHERYIGRVLGRVASAGERDLAWLEWDPDSFGRDTGRRLGAAVRLAAALSRSSEGWLTGGDDGALIDPESLLGRRADPDDGSSGATGLAALADLDDVALVAAPDASTLGSEQEVGLATQHLITNAEDRRYRIALVDAPPGSSTSDVRSFRGRFDSSRAALYHPWVITGDPLDQPAPGQPQRELVLPPSGFVAGSYARNDLERGVHEAPANLPLLGVTRLETEIDKRSQDVLNPEGINTLRFFPGRGYRVWGARTMSSDPEWKYVNLRRLLMYLEHSIERGTRWAVFEPNGEPLWASVRRVIEDFLLAEWQKGVLQGRKPEEAFFARCDRTTMTQDDIDNGRLIALVGVAPVKPAEFVIFRIGQWMVDGSAP